jgi:VWFA-related protein
MTMKSKKIMISNTIRLMILVIGVMVYSLPVLAGQYLKIETIDASTDFPKVKISLTVNGIDGCIGALDESDLTINEDGSRIDAPVKVTNYTGSENYLYLVFSIDSSKSISKKFLKSIKSSAREIARSIGSKDKIGVYQFDDSVILLNSFSQSTAEIIKNINSIERHGQKTLLYNSIYDSIELFDKVKQINKKVIVFTDGKDEGSSVSEEDIIKFSRNAMIPIYFICCKDSKNIRSMAHISKRTGGKLIYSTSNDVPGMYRTVMSVMKNRYTVTYPSKLKTDGMNHRIEVRLKYKEIRDRDTGVFYLEKKQTLGELLTVGNSIIVMNIILLMLLFLIVFYFIFREKQLLKKKQEIEKILLSGQTRSNVDPGIQPNVVEEQDASFTENENTYVSAWLYQKNGPEIGKKYPLQQQEIVIGSGKESTVIINDTTVSEKHLKIKNSKGIYTLFDLISDQGTYLNEKKLLRPKVLHDWDEIKIGATVLIFRASPFIGR